MDCVPDRKSGSAGSLPASPTTASKDCAKSRMGAIWVVAYLDWWSPNEANQKKEKIIFSKHNKLTVVGVL